MKENTIQIQNIKDVFKVNNIIFNSIYSVVRTVKCIIDVKYEENGDDFVIYS